MFGVVLAPGLDMVRLIALSGRRGKPPCIWEGPPLTDQATIEADINSDPRIRQWLSRNRLIRDGVATLNLQIDCYSQGKCVESVQVPQASILLGERRRKKTVNDEVTLRAIDLAEHLIDQYKQLVSERDTVIGRLVERALKQNETPVQPATVEVSKPDSIDDMLNKGLKFLSLANTFKSLKDKN